MIEVAAGPVAMLGECPLWSTVEDELFWVDIDGQRIHRFDPDSGSDEVRHRQGRPGSIGAAASASIPAALPLDGALAIDVGARGIVEPTFAIRNLDTSEFDDIEVSGGGGS